MTALKIVLDTLPQKHHQQFPRIPLLFATVHLIEYFPQKISWRVGPFHVLINQTIDSPNLKPGTKSEPIFYLTLAPAAHGSDVTSL